MDASKIIAIAPVPPPLSGRTLSSCGAIQLLASTGRRVHVVNTSPDVRLGSTGLASRICRRHRSASCLLRAASARLAGGCRGFYIVPPTDTALIAEMWSLLASRGSQIPKIIHLHPQQVPVTASYITRLLRVTPSLSGLQTTFVVYCERLASQIRTWPGVQDVYVVSNAAFMDSVIRPRSPDFPVGFDSNFRLGYLGALSYRKGVDRLPELMRRLIAAGLSPLLTIAGRVSDEVGTHALQRLTREFGDIATYLGEISPEQVNDFFERVDCLVLPSRSEGEPVVILEAMRAGVAVVATDTGCVADLAESSPRIITVASEEEDRVVGRLAHGVRRQAVTRSISSGSLQSAFERRRLDARTGFLKVIETVYP